MAVLFAGASSAIAQSTETIRIDPQSGSRVWIEGGSNLRNWSCAAQAFDARVELEVANRTRADTGTLAGLVQRVSVQVAVRDLKCGNRKMEKDLYRALKAEDASTPTYILATFSAVPGTPRNGMTVDTEGTLSVAGVERPSRARITLERLTDGTVKARGAVPLLMTDFGVKPPTGLFGLVRSKNEVTVKFELIIHPPQ